MKLMFFVIFILSLALAFLGGGFLERHMTPPTPPTYDERILLEIPKDLKGLRRQILFNKVQGAMLADIERWEARKIK
jgi:hypothetical protein